MRAWTRRRARRGATVVEAMVVLVLLLATMAVVALGVVRLYSEVGHSELLAHQPPDRAQTRPESGAVDPMPTAIEGQAEVEVATIADGLQVRTVLDTTFSGVTTWINPDPAAETVRLWVPVPAGARDVRFVVHTPEGPETPSGAVFREGGVEWLVALPAGEPLRVEVGWQAELLDGLTWPVAAKGRPIDVDFTLIAPPEVALRVPRGSLAPTTMAPGSLRWSLRQAVSPDPIRIEAPPGATPLGRVATVCALALLGLVAFGAGFWYLAEGERPGHLDDFHLGGLLLLALNYAGFFVIWAAAAPGVGAGPAAALAGAVALPLLTVHVARLTHTRFAAQRVLPLALATIALVLALAYLEPWRPAVALVAAVGGIAWVTLTFRDWSSNRQAWVSVGERVRRRTEREATLDGAQLALRRAADAASARIRTARRGLEELPAGLGAERAEVGRAAERLERTVARARSLWDTPFDAALLDVGEHAHQVDNRAAEVERAREAVSRQDEALRAADEALERTATRAHDDLAAAVGALERGLDQVGLARAEAAARAEQAPEPLLASLRELLDPIDGLNAAVHTLRTEAAEAPDPRAQASVARQLGQTAGGLVARLSRWSGLAAEASAHRGASTMAPGAHCPACGALSADGRFCSGCGEQRPMELSCPAWLGEPARPTRPPTGLGHAGAPLRRLRGGAPRRRARAARFARGVSGPDGGRVLCLAQRDAAAREGVFEVLRVEPLEGARCRALLADTVLYPEGGGQPWDLGTVDGVAVLAVRRTDEGFEHELSGPVPLGPARVALDWARRFDHMQQHTGQHLLSAVAADRFGWLTTSFHLHPGSSHRCDVELAAPQIDAQALEEAVNAEIRAAHPVRAVVYDEVPPGVRTRGLPEGFAGPVRLVEIGPLDRNTCGGTHVSNTAELQVLAILGTEPIRGGTRVSFVVGGRVLHRLAAQDQRLAAIGALLSRGEANVVDGVERALQDAKAAARAAADLGNELADQLGVSLAREPGPVRALHREGGDPAFLNRVATAALRAAPDSVVLLTAGRDDGLFLVAAPPEVLDRVRADVLRALDAQGGGPKGRLQGRAARLERRQDVLLALEAELARVARGAD